MGLFTRDPAAKAAKQAAKDAKRRAKEEKKARTYGLDTDGAVAIDRWYRDGDENFLLVFPDRIERHELGGLTGRVKDSKIIPMRKVSSVGYRMQGLLGVLTITTSEADIEWKTDPGTGPELRSTIMRLAAEAA